MSLTNTARSYGGVTKTFHWLTALLILTVIPLGLIANNLAHDIASPDISSTDADAARAALLFSLHKTLGLTIFAVALARIAWALSQPKPGLLNADNRVEATLAETVHWLLYGSLLLVPLTGWIHHSATTGFAPIWWPFGQSLPFVPKDQGVAALFAGLHIVLERVLIVAVFLHVAGALKHHFVDRDMTLRRMWPGLGFNPQPPAQHHSILPPVAALAIWAAAIGAGAAIGAYDNHHQGAPTEAAKLETVQSDWQVQDGTLEIAVTQLGSTVTGSFADWTAAITFDPPATPGPAGSVEVVIAIGSLTLGSVTEQALGRDFFDAGQFPTATFDGTIQKTDTGYVANGPLTIKGVSVPIALPFDLALDGDMAVMTGAVTLDRLDFGIGTGTKDEATLAFPVDVTVALTATRN